MTVSLPPQPQSKEVQAARKRRRRAPAGGAADDCFACVKRSVKCDRRRPYCSQCLEVGNECSGYKTQLTWGVGVASRGKLRGLSLPIAKSPPVAPVPKKTPVRSRANSSTASQWSDGDDGPLRSHRDHVNIHDHAVSLPTTPYTTYNDFARFSQGEAMSPAISTSWGSMPYSTGLAIHHEHHPKMHRLNTSLGHFPLMGDSLSAGVESLSDVEYTLSPMSHSYPREEMPAFMNSPTLMYESYTGHSSPVPQSPTSAIMIDQRAAPTSCPSLVYAPSDQSSSLGSHQDVFEPQIPGPRLLRDGDTLSVPEVDGYGTSPNSTSASYWAASLSRDDDTTPHGVEATSAHSAAPYDNHSLQVSADLIAKMPFFMDYYENIMCPGMVLIDGPNNPFRDHILQLASSSRSLQHAICALSACNLRMKRKLSLGQHNRESPEKFTSETAEAHPDDLPLSEEYQHRNLAVHLLNQQLNDTTKSCHDSVLATILLLSHYRMVESGVAKFQTQFAGVKKILGMRNSAPYQASSDSSWMEAIFTYFDAISASINDRESQLNHSFYNAQADSHLLPPGAENLIGCDRELFKTVAKLGRLNLLSQHRPVQRARPTSTRNGTPMRASSPLGSPLANSFNQNSQLGDFFSMGAQAHRFDGNGFATQLDDEEMLASGLCSSPSYDDHRSTFWREWKDARMALQNWEFDSQRLVASLPGSATQNQIRDLGSLSEAFRYAALLYTERLASPNVPSSHNNFRNLVSQVVYYATSLEAGSNAEKFLLWPMFVAGSECVNELQQSIVRNKCREIMSRSGYMNNLSAIEVLDRLWAGEYRNDNRSPDSKLGLRRGPLNWTKCIGGPGVEVEWIMF